MVTIAKNIVLKNKLCYKIGGKAKYFCEVKNKEEVLDVICWALKNRAHFVFLGAGTNVLFSDDGFKGLVIKNDYKKILDLGNEIYASSGVLMKNLVNYFSQKGFGGLDWAGGLPGTLGGAIYGNAGAFGGEIEDNVLMVESLSLKDGNMKLLKRSNKECKFGYRNSVFKEKENEIILGAYFKKKLGNKLVLKEKARAHIDYRKKYQPIEYPCAGSVFKNIPVKNVSKDILKEFEAVVKTDPFKVVPVAAVLDKLGLKGKASGGAQISSKHPNFIINHKKATAKDVLALIDLAKKEAKDKYGLELEEEIRFYGF